MSGLKEKPTVKITVIDPEELDEEMAGALISDNNETIPEQKTQEIFNLFKRNTRRSVNGTGAGLAMFGRQQNATAEKSGTKQGKAAGTTLWQPFIIL